MVVVVVASVLIMGGWLVGGLGRLDGRGTCFPSLYAYTLPNRWEAANSGSRKLIGCPSKQLARVVSTKAHMC